MPFYNFDGYKLARTLVLRKFDSITESKSMSLVLLNDLL